MLQPARDVSGRSVLLSYPGSPEPRLRLIQIKTVVQPGGDALCGTTANGVRALGQSASSCSRARNDRWFFVQLYRWFPSIQKILTIVQPETLVRWHRGGFRCYWRWKSRRRGGRSQIKSELPRVSHRARGAHEHAAGTGNCGREERAWPLKETRPCDTHNRPILDIVYLAPRSEP